jgi:two-component system, response regulator PdtaR
MNVLIAEPESNMIRNLKSILANLGHEVVDVVSTGEKAITLACNLSPDLILINIKLTGNMSGVEAGKKIADLYEIPVIFITVFTKNCLTKSLQLPDDAITLSIPVTQDHLEYSISRVFSS